jgi:hypothetical protein
MSFRAIIVEPDGTHRLSILNGYDDIKAALNGGWLEALHITENIVAFVDEEGKMKNLSPNAVASEICTKMQVGLHPTDIIVGPFILCGQKMSDDPEEGLVECDLPDDFINQFFGGEQN